MGLEITCKIVYIYLNVYFIGEVIYSFWAQEPKMLRSTVVRAFPFFCTIQIESAGSDSRDVEAKTQSKPKRIHPLKTLSQSTPWPKNIPGNIFWWVHPGFPEGLAFSALAHSGC